MTQAALTDVRRSVASLRSPLEQGGPLTEELASLVNNCRVPGLHIEYKVSGSPRTLSPQDYQIAAQPALERQPPAPLDQGLTLPEQRDSEQQDDARECDEEDHDALLVAI